MKNNAWKSILCLVLLTAVLAVALFGVNALTDPIVQARKGTPLFDRSAPESAEISVSADSVQSVYRNDAEQTYTLKLTTAPGWQSSMGVTLVVDYEGRIVSLTVDDPGAETKMGDLDQADFLPSFVGQDSTLAAVELVGGATLSSKAIRDAVTDGFNTLIENGLIAEAQKSDEQLLKELAPIAFSGAANASRVLQGRELQGSGSASSGFAAENGSGCFWYVEQNGEKLLAVYSQVGGVSVFNAESEEVTASADPALIAEVAALSTAAIGERNTELPGPLSKLLPEGAEAQPADIPGLTNCVVGAWTVETGEGTLFAFHARPYGYGNEPMDFYYVLDEAGAISAMRVKAIFIEEDYFPNLPQLDKAAYQDGFLGLTADSYDGEPAQIAGATISSDAADTAAKDVFEAFWLLTESRG
ncbi:MAG: FMN-binding protein [Oscillospiraceae bacterium]|nr:FMN-binding protein [Oscillospiraceae bacterium]